MSRQSGIFATITASSQTLYLASIDKTEIPSVTHALLQALFFGKNDNRFISYLETPSEISMVMEESSVALFPEDSIKISERRWRAIQFSIGASPTENEGLISIITAPLSRAGISIFMLSTFNTDYVLVEESKFMEAKECLKSNFSIIWADDADLGSTTTTSLQPVPSGDTPTPNVSSETINQLQLFSELSLYLTSIKTDDLDFMLKHLIQLMFFSESNTKRFLSFTQADGEISLILDENSLGMLPRERFENVIQDPWVPLKRMRKFGFIETGVVSALASPLRQLNLLYLSSFQTGYVLVMRKDMETAKSKLEEKGFVILSNVQKNSSVNKV